MAADDATPAAAYIAAAIPPASLDHYAVLMTDAGLRPAAAAALALGQVVANIAAGGGETEVRQLKLAWWLEESERLAAGQPRHPLTVELAAHVAPERWLAPLQTLVMDTARSLTAEPITTLAALLPACHRGAERQALLAAALPGCDRAALDRARQGGVAIHLTEFLRDPANSGSPPTAVTLPDGTDAPTIATAALEHFDALGPPAPGHLPGQRTVFLQAQLYRRSLERLRASGYDRARARSGPLRLLWQAWRDARKLSA